MNQFPHKISATGPGEIATEADLQTFLAAGRYQGYTYAYPHKTAYRWFHEPIPLSDVWASQSLTSTFLYAHIPFCEMRCGFCNLFTTSQPVEEREHAFIDALIRQVQLVRQNLTGLPVITSGAIGGGTPTILSETNLERLFLLLAETFGFDYADVPFSVETSPETATSQKIAILSNYSVQRASIGVQSWFAEELRSMGRPQDVRQTHEAVDRLRTSAVDRLNIDLIYGAHGQTSQTMAANIAETLLHEPDEIFLYPLYVRPLTGLGRNSLRSWDDDRLNQYRTGRDALLEAGFQQTSMRRFEKTVGPSIEQSEPLPLEAGFECQTDPTIGLGPGARSYTTSLHYSSDWAVSREQVGSIIDTFIGASEPSFSRPVTECNSPKTTGNAVSYSKGCCKLRAFRSATTSSYLGRPHSWTSTS
jgi:oxygen-independent coproporphyrinogen III oxidase